MISTLMVVDDNEIDQKLLARVARRSGCVGTIVGCPLAEDALAHLSDPEAGKVDAILLDLNMPRMDGFEFLQKAREVLKEDMDRMVIVILTTSMSGPDRNRADAVAEVEGYFFKPFSLDQLVSLDALVEARKAA